MKLYISIDKKNKSDSLIKEQIADAKAKAEQEIGNSLTATKTLSDADCAWFVDEWEDDIECYKEHEYCKANNIKILHDKSEFWNRTI